MLLISVRVSAQFRKHMSVVGHTCAFMLPLMYSLCARSCTLTLPQYNINASLQGLGGFGAFAERGGGGVDVLGDRALGEGRSDANARGPPQRLRPAGILLPQKLLQGIRRVKRSCREGDCFFFYSFSS